MDNRLDKMDVIVDIDGTLADASHRLHFIQTKPKNWKAFFAAMGKDEPIRETITVVNSLWNSGYRIVLASGRPENYRAITAGWLRYNRVYHDMLFMRGAGDKRPDDIVKRELLTSIRVHGFQPKLAIDDRDRVVEMWRSEGLRCWQVAPGDF
jgi:uncharacterized HAD superfamily protein